MWEYESIMKIPRKLKNKFIAITIAFIVISVGLPSFLLLRQIEINFQERSQIMLRTTLDVVKSGLFTVMMSGKQKNLQSLIERLADSDNVEHIRLFNDDGLITRSSVPSEIGKPITGISPHHKDFREETTRTVTKFSEIGLYSASEPILNEVTCRGCHGTKPVIAYLDIDTNMTLAEQKFFQNKLLVVVMAAGSIIMLAIGSFILFDYFIDRPILRHIQAMEKLEQGELDTRIQVTTEDEFGFMAEHFNSMVEKIQASSTELDNLHFEQLQRADKLVTLGELAAEMAHEINNPAAIVMSRADYLNMESGSGKTIAEYEEDLNVIVRQTEKISAITGRILKYSKKLPHNFVILDVQSLLDEALLILQPRLKKMEIKLVKDYTSSPVKVFGDALQIEQVFTNLLNNALDAMKPGGQLEIKYFQKDDKVYVAVADDGEGIDPLRKDDIFTPFFTTKGTKNGTGLGLYIVKNICKNHNAEINVRDRKSGGTVFTVAFKISKEDA